MVLRTTRQISDYILGLPMKLSLVTYIMVVGGTSIYTGAQRYSLKNFGIQQHRLQAEGSNWFLRGYTTLENSGDSYITEFYAKRVLDLQTENSILSGFGVDDVSGWLGTYAYNYLASLHLQGVDPQNSSPTQLTEAQRQQAFEYARTNTEAFFAVDFDSPEGKALLEEAANGTVPSGPKFNDQSRLYHAEGQYDLSEQLGFMDLLVGASFRQYDLRSNGTIFPDSENDPIKINEYGAFAQGSKKVMDDKLNLVGSVRIDKNENFNAVFSPRLAAVLTVADNHNFRVSAQTGFRNPTTQGQYIDLDIISSRLLGGLPSNINKYEIGSVGAAVDANDTYTYVDDQGDDVVLSETLYTVESIEQMASEFYANPTQPLAIENLQQITDFKTVQPEQVQSLEIGYKSVVNNKLLIDFVGYFNSYNNFIVQQRMRRASIGLDGNENYFSLLNGNANSTYQVYTNANEQISAYGFAGELSYTLPKRYSIGFNYNYNKLNTQNASDDFVFGFNTPEHKFNIKFGNRKLTDKLGFNLVYRWQSEFYWESSFGDGTIPAYGTADIQFTYKVPSIRSMIKVGGSNIFNDYYYQSFGAPRIGAIYYVSITFDQLMN